MMTQIEPETITESGSGQKPSYYQSMAGNALQDRLGSKTTYSGYMKVVNQLDITVTGTDGSQVTTEILHGVSSSIPFVFLYLKKDGYYTRMGFSDNTGNGRVEGYSNASIDDKYLSFTISNSQDQVYLVRAIIFEVAD